MNVDNNQTITNDPEEMDICPLPSEDQSDLKLCPFDDIPNEILCKILNYSSNPKDLSSFRLVSTRFKNATEEGCDHLTTRLDDKLFQKIDSNPPPHHHSFKRFQVHLATFSDIHKNILLSLMRTSTFSFENMTLSLETDRVSSLDSVTSLLEQTSHVSSGRMKLKMGKNFWRRPDTFASITINPPTAPIHALPQLVSLDYHAAFIDPGEVTWLLDIVKNCPNLESLSIGDENWNDANRSSRNLTKFLISIENQRPLQLSLVSIRASWFYSPNFLSVLKQKNISFRQIHFQSFNTDSANVEVIKFSHKNIDFIYNLSVGPHEPFVTCPLNELKVLGILCGLTWLESLVKNSQKLEKLAFYDQTHLPRTNTIFNNIRLPNLTTLGLLISFPSDVEVFGILAPACPNVKNLICYMSEDQRINCIYELFPNLERLQIARNEGISTVNLLGLEQEPGGQQGRPGSQAEPGEEEQGGENQIIPPPQRLPHMGLLKKLRVLSFGTFHFYIDPDDMTWQTDVGALCTGLADLDELEEIVFPPLGPQWATDFLTALRSSTEQQEQTRLTKLKEIHFQVWDGDDDEGENGTLTRHNIEVLGFEFEAWKMSSSPVMSYDGAHHVPWF